MAWLVLTIWLQNPVPNFERDVRPIFEQSCHECHGPSRQKGGLRLDQKAAAFAGSSFGREPVLVPSDLDASTLWWMVSEPNNPDRMPPMGEKPALSSKQVEILRKWIEDGAAWPDDGATPSWPSRHWAYAAPRRPKPPQVANPAAVRNPVDQFVFAASRQTISPPLRRLNQKPLLEELPCCLPAFRLSQVPGILSSRDLPMKHGPLG